MTTTTDDRTVSSYEEDLQARRTIVQRLTELRTERGLSQRELAGYLNTVQSSISDFEHGAIEPRLVTLQRWARAFGFRLDLFLNDSVIPEKTGDLNSGEYIVHEDVDRWNTFFTGPEPREVSNRLLVDCRVCGAAVARFLTWQHIEFHDTIADVLEIASALGGNLKMTEADLAEAVRALRSLLTTTTTTNAEATRD